jgi:hypothetical protein
MWWVMLVRPDPDMYLGEYNLKLPRLHRIRRLVEGTLEGEKWSVVVQVPFIRNKFAKEEQESLLTGM